jgi:hypothetical protein
MAFLRDFVRTGYLKPFFSLQHLHVSPQYSPMLVFLAVLVPGVAVIVWMLMKARQSVLGR